MWHQLKKKTRTAGKMIAHEVPRLYRRRICYPSDVIWRYFANFAPALEYRKLQKQLTPVQERLLTDLNLNGIAIASVRELVGDTRLFDELEVYARQSEKSLADRINKARNRLLAGGYKDYLFRFLESHPGLTSDHILIRFALQPEFLAIANSYFGMLTKLMDCNVWLNFITQGDPKESQLWHRDWEDRHVLKAFVYLADVDEGTGPLSYAPGTHPKGGVKAEPKSTLVRNGARRTDDLQMDAVVPKERWVTATGAKGTIVFVDTIGYHKGGLARRNERLLFTCMFTSQASILRNGLRLSLAARAHLDKATEFALRD